MNRAPALPRSGYLLLVGGIGLLLAEPLTRRKVAALGLVLGETEGTRALAAVLFPSAARPSAPA